MSTAVEEFDLIVIGGTPAGLTLAADASAAGLPRVIVLERSESVVPVEAAGRLKLNVRYQTPVISFRHEHGGLTVGTPDAPLHSRVVAYADLPPGEPVHPPYRIPDTVADRVHFGCADLPDQPGDVLVVGGGEQATACAKTLAERGNQVVLALLGDVSELSQLSQEILAQLEQTRQATILWQSAPDALGDVGGFPMAYFDDRRTPDLQFDHVVYALGIEEGGQGFADLGIETSSSDQAFFLLRDASASSSEGWQVPARAAWPAIRSARFGDLPAPHDTPPLARREELATRHYNATITHFEKTHSDLWLVRVRPDTGSADHRPGQYATLGLGYWEPRIDAAVDQLKEGQIEKLARRSYSISSPVFDEYGYLVNPYAAGELEFYIVLVPPTDGRVPGLTPRLALKEVGDRMYLGPKITGRYTLDSVTDPSSKVVFLATGTGEAPHNAMIAELLRKGHHGPIVSVVTVRNWSDLGYRGVHAELTRRYSNYHYLPMPTREPDVPKRYIQDLITSGDLDAIIPQGMDPASTSVFMCGNPAMIGPPSWAGDVPTFPKPKGVVEILVDRGFTADRRESPGNVHFEEYW